MTSKHLMMLDANVIIVINPLLTKMYSHIKLDIIILQKEIQNIVITADISSQKISPINASRHG